eukprot:gene2002-2607_t
MKKVLCVSLVIENISLHLCDFALNTQLAVNFLVSLLKKNRQNTKVMYIKSIVGPPRQIFYQMAA